MTPGPGEEICPDCKDLLPAVDGPAHRYIGASPACWLAFSSLVNGGQPPMMPSPVQPLIVDAYAAQHPGQPCRPAIRSVAIHALVLYGIFEAGVEIKNAAWIRNRALRPSKHPDAKNYHWLTPPDFGPTLKISDIVAGATPAERVVIAERYAHSVWSAWADVQRDVFESWYQAYVVPDRIS